MKFSRSFKDGKETTRLQQMDYPNGQKLVLDYYENEADQRLKQIHILNGVNS